MPGANGEPGDGGAAGAPAVWRYATGQRVVASGGAALIALLAMPPVVLFALAAFGLHPNGLVTAGIMYLPVSLLILPLAIAAVRQAAIEFGFRLSLDGEGLEYAVPERWMSARPGLRFRRGRIALADIVSVDRRDEVVRFLRLPGTLNALSIVGADGRRLELVRCQPGPQVLPVDEIAGRIADAAGLAVTDLGTVEAGSSLGNMLRGRSVPWAGEGAPQRLSPKRLRSVRSVERVLATLVGLSGALVLLAHACSR